MLNKTAQQRGLEEYADAIQKVANVHNIDPHELDSFLTGQTMEKNAQNEYADALNKVASAYDVDPYELDRALTKESVALGPLANLGPEIAGMAPELAESAGKAGREAAGLLENLKGQAQSGGADLLSRIQSGGAQAADKVQSGGAQLLENIQDAGGELSQQVQRQRSLRSPQVTDRLGVAANDLGARVKDIVPGMEGATYSDANKAMGLGATGAGAAGTGGLLAGLKKKLRG